MSILSGKFLFFFTEIKREITAYSPSSKSRSECKKIFGIFETVVSSCNSWFKYSVAVSSSGTFIFLAVVVLVFVVSWLDEICVVELYNLAFLELVSCSSCVVLSRGKVFCE